MGIPEVHTQATLLPPGTWRLDPARSHVGFEVRHLKLTKVCGRFCQVEGTIRSADSDSAVIRGVIDVASIDPGDARRDSRLCSEAFFGAEDHPTIEVHAVATPASAPEHCRAHGTIRIRDVEGTLDLDVDRPSPSLNGDGDLRLRARGILSRRAFGLNWDPAFAAGGLVIDDSIRLVLNVVLTPVGGGP